MRFARLCFYLILLIAALTLGAYIFALASNAQSLTDQELKPDLRRALVAHEKILEQNGRQDGYLPSRVEGAIDRRPLASLSYFNGQRWVSVTAAPRVVANLSATTETVNSSSIGLGTPLSRVLHTSQLSLVSSAGTDEELISAPP